MMKNNTSFSDRSHALLEKAAKGQSSVLVVHGVSGVGQSDAVQTMMSGVSTVAGGLVLEGRCTAQATRPFEPIYDIVQTLQRSASADCNPVLLAAVTARLAQTATEYTGVNEPKRCLDQLGGVRDRRVNRFEDVRRLLCEVAQKRTLLVVLHDVHLADDDTRKLVDYLVRDVDGGVPIIGAAAHRSTRPSFVLTLNDDMPEGRRCLRQFQSYSVAESVAIAPLDEDGLASLMAEPALAAKLLRMTDGRPARLRALVSALPNALDDLIGYRLMALADEDIHVLRVLEAANEPLIPGTLAAVTSVSWSTLNTLQADEFLVDEVVDGKSHVRLNDAYANHRLVAARNDEEHRAIHGLWADYWLGQFAVTSEQEQHLRAFRHLFQAERFDEAVSIALSVHQWLLKNGSLQQSVDLLQSVMHVDSPQREALTIALIDTHVALGRFEKALALCNELVDSTEPFVDMRRAQIHGLQGDLDAAQAGLSALYEAKGLPSELRELVCYEWIDVLIRKGMLEQAEALCDSLSNDHEVVIQSRGKIAFWRGEYTAAQELYQRLLTTLTAEQDDIRAVVLHNLGLVDLRLGQYRQASRYLQESLAMFEGQARYFEATVCRHNLGIAYEYGHRLGLASAMFEQTIDGFERLGKKANLAGAINSLGDLYLGIGEYWKARRLFEHSQSIAEKNGLDYLCAFNALRLGQLARVEGDIALAIDQLTGALETLETLGHSHESVEARLALAQCAEEQRDTETVRAHLAVIAGSEHEECVARSQLIEAMLERQKKPTQALTTVTHAERALERLEQWSGVAEACLLMGRILSDVGQHTEANKAFSKGRSVVEKWRMNVPEAQREAFDEQAIVAGLMQAESVASASAVKTTPQRSISRQPPKTPSEYRHIIGRSSVMRKVFKTIERIAASDATILVVGESGTGKELIAQAIFSASNRADKPFVRVNAAAFADSLLESELFGHEKGSFTGAVARKIGAFEQADGGTLFLDEIGDISPKMQVSLLRALQEGEVRRVGGRRPIHVNVRVVCATNRNLSQMVQDGTFRQDLYFRINGLPIHLPALRNRGDDLDLIADHILSNLADQYNRGLSLDDSARALIRRHRWPGNVRELENVLRSVIFFVDGDRITDEHLLQYTALRDAEIREETASQTMASDVSETIGEGFDLAEAKRTMEIAYIQRALEQTNGNITKAASLLSMKRPRLSQKIKEYRLKGLL